MFHKFNLERLPTLEVNVVDDSLEIRSAEFSCLVRFSSEGIEKVEYSAKDEVHLISENDAMTVVVGSGNSERRVTHFLRPTGPASSLRLGLTEHLGDGTWSSLPHGFEKNVEPGFEELFMYLLDGGTRTAVQRGHGIWCNGEEVDDAWLVRDRDLSVIPMGYHPVVGEPGVTVRYLWAYLAKHDRWEKITNGGEPR